MQPKLTTVIGYGLLATAAVVMLVLPPSLSPRSITAAPAESGDVVLLTGSLRDFAADHPDFDVTSPSDMGHYVGNVSPALGGDRRPAFRGGGSEVRIQWYDKDGNPIAPYEGGDDGGLPGGHFDVDVFDAPTDRERDHEHQFDDKYDVTYVDLVNDPKLLYDDIIGTGYAGDVRVEFHNPERGSGTYTLEAGATRLTGRTRDGLDTTFSPSELAALRVDLASLRDLQATAPGRVQHDVPDRDGAFSIRLFDAASGTLVYELAVYHHGDPVEGFGAPTLDSCGDEVADVLGTLSGSGDGGVTSAESFDQWYRDVPGTNLSMPHTIGLRRNVDGIYEYLSDEFYPADGRGFGNEGEDHNNHFTFDISATFTYEACTDQFFEFEGNDDAWVFIDDTMAIDLGGAATPDRQYVALDRLGLADGQTYRFSFFFSHRRDDVSSVFRMRTNIELQVRQPPTVSAAYD